jgi:hypothetical protein
MVRIHVFAIAGAVLIGGMASGLWTAPAAAQTICGVSADGNAPVSAQGSTATAGKHGLR